MGGGEIRAVFQGLAAQAEQAGKAIAESVAKVGEQTADIEEASLARILDVDAKVTKKIDAAGRGAELPPPAPSGPIPGMDLPVEVVADKIAMHAGDRSIPGVPDNEISEYLERIMSTPGYPLRRTPSGTPRMGWWDEETSTLVIREGNDGTFMQPDIGYQKLLKESQE